MIDASEFRRVLGHFASGVTIVTTNLPDGGPCGLTASSFCSVSLRPTLVLVCVERSSDSHDCIRGTGAFAVNMLQGEDGEPLSRRFSAPDIHEKFQGVAWRAEATGAPVLAAALAWVDCRVTQETPAGDHTIFLGEVMAGDASEGSPLVYYRGGYGRFVP